jgi:hypothetical protein
MTLTFRYLVLFAFCLTAPVRNHAQGLPQPFVDSTVFISYKVNANQGSTGSGFVLLHQVNEKIRKLYLVTNRHVLPDENGPKEITIRVNVKQEGTDRPGVQEVDIPVRGDDHKLLSTVRVHATLSVDVAIVDITKEANEKRIVFPHDVLGDDWLITKEELKSSEITLGYEIYLLGYPASMYDPQNTSPLLRVGVIASDPVTGYSFNGTLQAPPYNLPAHVDGFLIDANVFPGSSGSMVVLRPGPVYKNGTLTLGGATSQPRILGIVADSIPIIDVALRSVTRMGLGVAFSAQCIRDTIALFP